MIYKNERWGALKVYSVSYNDHGTAKIVEYSKGAKKTEMSLAGSKVKAFLDTLESAGFVEQQR